MGEVILTTLPDKTLHLTEPYSLALSNHPQQFRDWTDGTNISLVNIDPTRGRRTINADEYKGRKQVNLKGRVPPTSKREKLHGGEHLNNTGLH